MPLPPGIAPAYAWCLLWFALGSAVIGLFRYLANDDQLRERVHARSYERLWPLNEWINRQIEIQWSEHDIIPEADTLLDLKRRVDRAARLHTHLVTRGLWVYIGYAVGAGHVISATGTAIALYAGAPEGVPSQVAVGVAIAGRHA